ncbi:MAG TPA: hypothetical protein VL137_01580 [Polyangiaceae bacterium]|nr:hypothetical protein [Polyangiaceae bacterium]
MRRLLSAIGPCLLALALLSPGKAAASAEAEVRYSKAQTFSSALRYLRVDLGYTVTEKDADAAYLMFEFPRSDQKKLTMGTIEIIENSQSQVVKIVVHLAELPEYRERLLADGLLAKLRQELGEPPPPKSAPEDKPKAPPSDGKPGDDKKGKPAAPSE